MDKQKPQIFYRVQGNSLDHVHVIDTVGKQQCSSLLFCTLTTVLLVHLVLASAFHCTHLPLPASKLSFLVPCSLTPPGLQALTQSSADADCKAGPPILQLTCITCHHHYLGLASTLCLPPTFSLHPHCQPVATPKDCQCKAIPTWDIWVISSPNFQVDISLLQAPSIY